MNGNQTGHARSNTDRTSAVYGNTLVSDGATCLVLGTKSRFIAVEPKSLMGDSQPGFAPGCANNQVQEPALDAEQITYCVLRSGTRVQFLDTAVAFRWRRSTGKLVYLHLGAR